MGAFGIRRPLRMLSHRLGLDESQTAVLAEFLDDLRTEQAQAEVDKRRASKLLAGAMAGESFDSEAAAKATKLRAQASERVIEHTAKGLRALHEVLDPEQRQRFVTLMRTGPFTF